MNGLETRGTQGAGEAGGRVAGAPVSRNPAGARTFRCTTCGYPVTLLRGDTDPRCPSCGGTSFERASLFLDTDTRGWPAPAREPGPSALERARAQVDAPGRFLALEEGDETRLVRLAPESIVRLGRSLQADVRLDHLTVSRRHAVVHWRGSSVAITDDHSLNGVFVNGERIEWAPLSDGDEIQVGAYRLLFIDASGEEPVAEGREEAPGPTSS